MHGSLEVLRDPSRTRSRGLVGRRNGRRRRTKPFFCRTKLVRPPDEGEAFNRAKAGVLGAIDEGKGLSLRQGVVPRPGTRHPDVDGGRVVLAPDVTGLVERGDERSPRSELSKPTTSTRIRSGGARSFGRASRIRANEPARGSSPCRRFPLRCTAGAARGSTRPLRRTRRRGSRPS